MKKTAAETAATAPASVAPGADGGGRVHERRLVTGLSQRELAERAGCGHQTIGALERGEKVPSVELAERIAAALGATLVELFGAPRQCECGCGLLTFSRHRKGHYHPGPDGHRKRAAQLEAYKREHGYLGTAELEQTTGRRQTSLARDVRDGRLEARVYPGAWNGNPPLLFEPDAVATVRQIQTVERHRSYVERGLANHASRRARGLGGTKPARGETRECPLPGCDELVYLHPGETRPGYCSVEHANLARVVDDRWPERLYEHWRGGRTAFERARARLIRQLGAAVEKRGGHRLTVLGKYAATLAAANDRRVGRPPALDETERAQVGELAAKGKSGRAIARILTAKRRDRDPRAKAVSASTVEREAKKLRQNLGR